MKYVFKTKPWPHQVKGMKYVLRRMALKGSGGLQVPMRWGKTKVTIDVAGVLHLKYGITRVLAVTTTSGLGVWEKEIPKHCPFPVRVINYLGEVVYETKNAALEPVPPALTWYVIHHAVLYGRDFDWGETAHEWTPGPNRHVEDFDPELIAIDEAHKIGDPSSMQSKMAYRYGKNARFRMTLTGTSFHRGPQMVFGQMKFLDDSIFGTTITAFRRMYVQFGGYGNYEVVGYQNLRHMAKRLREALFIQVKPPMHRPPVVNTTPVDLMESRKHYRNMERENAITVNGQDITAPIILTRHLRCQQIAGGWVKSEDGKYIRVGAEKQRALTDKLITYQEEGIDKVVIMCRFIPEIRDIARAATDAGYRFVAMHGGVPRGEERTRRVERFQASEEPVVFIGQVQAVAEAIDLSEASVMIWYSLPESYLLYDQGKARIEKYMDKRTLYYDHILARGTRDEVTWLAMNLKMDVARFLVTRPQVVERITRRDIHPVIQ